MIAPRPPMAHPPKGWFRSFKRMNARTQKDEFRVPMNILMILTACSKVCVLTPKRPSGHTKTCCGVISRPMVLNPQKRYEQANRPLPAPANAKRESARNGFVARSTAALLMVGSCLIASSVRRSRVNNPQTGKLARSPRCSPEQSNSGLAPPIPPARLKRRSQTFRYLRLSKRRGALRGLQDKTQGHLRPQPASG